jgi:exodeoxyribonuclease V beta subunit
VSTAPAVLDGVFRVTASLQIVTMSTTIKKLEPLNVPLQGINLIEASAGTGKTYTITTLFLRLIIEKKLPIDKILVVTFTEAATEELRDRVRRRLREALSAFEQGSSKDNVLTGLLTQYPDHHDAILRLTNALRGFDEAAIFTIHSFCWQTLQDNAFESGVLFDTELIEDQTPYLREIVEDFWRQHFYNASPLLVTYALKQGFNKPEQLLKTLHDGLYVGQPFLRIIPQIATPAVETEELGYYTAFLKAKQSWQAHGREIEELLLADTQLNANKYRQSSIPSWCREVANFLNAPVISVKLPENFQKFTTATLLESVKKGKTPPQHQFFDHCETLWQRRQALNKLFDEYLLALKVKLFHVAEQALIQKKYQQHFLHFNDLLIHLYKALTGSKSSQLINLIRYKYLAALIDEFQDTDSVQYQIFRKVYADHEQRILFLIGDPKQAIYSFRGADIFTYMIASRDAQNRYTLTTNWRSEVNLIASVNQLFTRVTKHPFWFESIAFQPVQAPHEEGLSRNQPSLKIENKSLPPLQLWFVSRQQASFAGDKPINKGWAQQQIPLSVANEIARLLMLGQQEQALIGDKPLMAGDIAILVRTNRQALQMQKVLTRLQIPSVLYSKESLFASHEVAEMERILLAIADPNHESLIKSALLTDIFGITGDELQNLLADELRWQIRLNQFQRYHFLWKNKGFIRMYRTLLTNEQVPSHLLRYADGERRLTNVLHLGEVLQQVSMQGKLGIGGLCQWLAQQRLQPDDEKEEQQLRLESDEKRVKIVTIHGSKGLEYPIVFCPFLWDGTLHTSKEKQFIYHNEREELVLDLGSPEQEKHRLQALQEEQAENLRLFYVALTRAKHRCYLIWGAFRDASNSPLAHLLHAASAVEQIPDERLLEDLQALAAESKNCIQISPLPVDQAPYYRVLERPEILQPRYFKGKIDNSWKVSSFSALSAMTMVTETVERPDYDEELANYSSVERVNLPPSEKNLIFTFPRGARAGNFMHALFERLDFTCPELSLIQEQLATFGFSVEHWQNVIFTLVENVLQTPLEPQQPNFTLAQVSKDKRLNELEFYYPLAPISVNGIHKILLEFGHQMPLVYEETPRLELVPVQGFMKGYIDMIFEYQGRYYLVDYKSNFLGTQMHAYHHSQLKNEMIQAGYVLQYHIYAIALHRYLAIRVPNYRYEAHFGGIYYLFLRGIRPVWGPLYGIYRDLPSKRLIERLSNYFGENKVN